MTKRDRTVSNHEVIPLLASAQFADHPAARLGCGIIAHNGIPHPDLHAEYAAHFTLRRNVYVDQTGQLDATELCDDGTDRDSDDKRSVTFAVLENHRTGVRMVGVSRLIIRGTETPLPVEDFCEDVFAHESLHPNSVEVSRVIARHENAAVQDLIQWHLFAAMLAHISTHQLGRTFAIIEPWFERHLNGAIAIRRIGEPRYVAHYLDYNLPIEIDIPQSTARVNAANDGFIERHQAAAPNFAHFGRVHTAARTANTIAEAAA